MAPLVLLQSLLFFLAAVCCAEFVNQRASPSAQSRALVKRLATQANYGAEGRQELVQELDLLDIVLVASVDGKFHALNRVSGQRLWSMSSATTGGSAPSSLAPLVRTGHIDYDPDEMDDSASQETYIIEPQSGDIYVITHPDGSLQRFPFSMPELVEMSPFTAPGDDEKKMFIGRKETSLILLELETGKIKATLNSECPPYEAKGIDLDELEKSDTRTPSTTEVFIARTDYYISIYTQSSGPSSSGIRPAVQNLSFSVYGPNNKDNALQASYRRTKDNSYIQGLPDGAIIAFETKFDGSQIESKHLWGQTYDAPIVAVFDVLRGATPLQHHPHAFVLLQPRPRLVDLLPNVRHGFPREKENTAYVGMVEELGSLFALSPSHYPLAVFGSSEPNNKVRLIDSPNAGGSGRTVDEITRARKKLEERLKCEENPSDPRCLVGMHVLGNGDGHESRMRRLLEGPKNMDLSAGLRPGQGQWLDHGIPVIGGNIEAAPNGSGSATSIPTEEMRTTRWEALGVTFLFGLLSLWFLLKKFGKKGQYSTTRAVSVPNDGVPSVPVLPAVAEEVDNPVPVLEAAPAISPVLPPNPETVLQEAPIPAAEEGEDSDREGEADAEATPTPGRRKPRRGKRGKKKKVAIGQAEDEAEGKGSSSPAENGTSNGSADPVLPSPPPSSLVIATSPIPEPAEPSLFVSDTILGYGSHGTVVYKGSLQGRAVAVKRLLRDFVTLASREVSILQESDDHPNVIRYYYQEAHANFLYIALELCPASLADVIECPDREQFRDIAISFDPKKALKQVTNGLRHLHALKLVHRDIKPQNILITTTKSNVDRGRPTYRMLISDFGLCKKLDVDQTSFLPTTTGGMAAGTVGWRAPEILRGEVKLDDMSDDHSMSSRGSVATANGSSGTPTTSKPTRLTKSVDIFALGCLYYYTLTNGGHPYGDRFEREVNILKNEKNLDLLERYGEEGTEACDLINQMLDPEAYERPDTTSCLLHPFFWDPGRRLNFLQDASDRFEIMCRDPKDPNLLELEREAVNIVGNDWHSRLDKIFIENLGKFRKYDGRSVQDLLRALRNKKHHYQDLPENVKRHLGPMPEGFLAYFTRRYPKLFLHVHGVIKHTGLRTESMFRTYFELPE